MRLTQITYIPERDKTEVNKTRIISLMFPLMKVFIPSGNKPTHAFKSLPDTALHALPPPHVHLLPHQIAGNHHDADSSIFYFYFTVRLWDQPIIFPRIPPPAVSSRDAAWQILVPPLLFN